MDISSQYDTCWYISTELHFQWNNGMQQGRLKSKFRSWCLALFCSPCFQHFGSIPCSSFSFKCLAHLERQESSSHWVIKQGWGKNMSPCDRNCEYNYFTLVISCKARITHLAKQQNIFEKTRVESKTWVKGTEARNCGSSVDFIRRGPSFWNFFPLRKFSARR